ncbi:MAG: sugar phosphate isomerase/epimerase family protein [Phycisphaerae bacterium]
MSKLTIGVLVGVSKTPAKELAKVTGLGLHSCQVSSWDPAVWTDEVGKALITAAREMGVTITTFWAGYTGPRVWNFTEGPKTIGLVPPQFRAQRLAELKQAARFAAALKLPSITTHVGFLPEDPNDAQYIGTVDALRELATLCRELGIEFWFETGQETPVNLLRTIELIGTGNVGINLDPANLILYGKANPIDALDVFGRYVRGVHAKDGLYPTDGRHLGKETPLGQGKVNFPALVPKLKSLGFSGALTIEREIGGEQQIRDIKSAIELLRPLC